MRPTSFGACTRSVNEGFAERIQTNAFMHSCMYVHVAHVLRGFIGMRCSTARLALTYVVYEEFAHLVQFSTNVQQVRRHKCSSRAKLA